MNKNVRKVHFVGIGGIGMSGIAEVLLSYGYIVSGSDLKKNTLTERLSSLGAKIYYGHQRKNLGDAQVLVYSSAVKEDNCELKEANKRNIPAIPRGKMLSEILRKGFSIAVSGAHGKTTTTAMISSIIRSPKIVPTVIIGGIIKGVSKNAILGKGKVFVAEADESDGTFQRIKADIAVITNLDREHMDYYGDFKKMDDAYVKFMNGVPFDGLLVVHGDDKRLNSLTKSVQKRTLTYGFDKLNDLQADNIATSGMKVCFDLKMKDKKLGRIVLPITGKHNILNSMAACLVGIEMGMSFSQIKRRLRDFQGIERRMEIKGLYHGATIVDDYAHHPTEIKSTLSAAKEMWKKSRIVVVFQPHRYSRIKDLMLDFPDAFKQADLIYVTDIYRANEKRVKKVNGSSLAKLLNKKGKNALYIKNWREGIDKVRDEVKKGDVVFTLGAGDINSFYEHLIVR